MEKTIHGKQFRVTYLDATVEDRGGLRPNSPGTGREL